MLAWCIPVCQKFNNACHKVNFQISTQTEMLHNVPWDIVGMHSTLQEIVWCYTRHRFLQSTRGLGLPYHAPCWRCDCCLHLPLRQVDSVSFSVFSLLCDSPPQFLFIQFHKALPFNLCLHSSKKQRKLTHFQNDIIILRCIFVKYSLQMIFSCWERVLA